MNEKIKGHQLEREAYVYVRQSTPYQVRNHLEKLVVGALPAAAQFSGVRSLEDMEREGAERNVEEVG